ncbi:MAG: adenosylcobinamide-phosphate synthase CbiB [Rikenellaceae bacterium]
MEINATLAIVVAGSLLDTLIGDPYWMPHPIRLFGNMISFMEQRLNKGARRVVKGAFMWFVLCSVVWLFFYFVGGLLIDNQIVYAVWSAIFFFFALSSRCLIEEGLKVERVLQSGDVVAARNQLSMIVGRQTKDLDAHQIRSAVVETLSENLSDGVVAPLFYFAIGGVPLMMLYKMINTLDSMVGYKSDRYLDFGRISAKMDDVANFIPARLTALLMALVSLSCRALVHIFKYAHCHASPNSGYPESALSGILDCRLGGPNSYFGKIVDKPYIGKNSRELTHRDVVRTALINAKVALVCYLLLMFLTLLTASGGRG